MRSLHDFVAVYDNALPRDACEHLIKSFEDDRESQKASGRGVYPGLDESLWTERLLTQQEEPRLSQYFFSLVGDYYARFNARSRLTRDISPVRQMNELVIKRYRPGGEENFQVHFDSLGDRCNRYLVYLWYLNDVVEGGETWFPDLDLKVKPTAGRLLMFPPYWMFQHAGLPPKSGNKYIVSTYAVY